MRSSIRRWLRMISGTVTTPDGGHRTARSRTLRIRPPAPLALKTVHNIMDGSFRAMVRDCRTVDLLIATDPFSAVKWPRVQLPPLPDPFTDDERDAIIAWFFEHRRFYHPFVFTLFHTGQRPSEAVALR